jgi:CheY-like chemotaxis protein
MTDAQDDTETIAILYVDDEDKALKYFRRALEPDYKVYTASSVDEALVVLEEHGDQVGVIVTDQRMPGRTGVDLLRQVRRERPEIVRLLTTAYAELDDAVDAVNSGEIFRYITKPWGLRELHAELRQAIEVFRLKREHALLVAEKLSVWQRLVGVNRIRDLAVMAHSFVHVRNAPAAVAAYLTDRFRDAVWPGLAEPVQLDLWALTESEIGRTAGLLQRVARNTRPREGEPGFADRLSAGALLTASAPPRLRLTVREAEDLPELRVNAELARHMFLCLLQSLKSEEVTVRVAPAQSDAAALSFVFPYAPGGSSDRSDDAKVRDLTAYLVAYHHGGTISPIVEAGRRTGVHLLLPLDPLAAAPREPEPDWVHKLLLRLERWN